ncbi:hypothetical protein D3C71_1365760 [compost metagenome]
MKSSRSRPATPGSKSVSSQVPLAPTSRPSQPAGRKASCCCQLNSAPLTVALLPLITRVTSKSGYAGSLLLTVLTM